MERAATNLGRQPPPGSKKRSPVTIRFQCTQKSDARSMGELGAKHGHSAARYAHGGRGTGAHDRTNYRIYDDRVGETTRFTYRP
jgi:hypothetical protein